MRLGMFYVLSVSSFFATPARTAPAQGGVAKQARKVIEKIQKEMEEIDRLLDQASRRSADPDPSPASVKKLLEQSLDSNKQVIDNIQKLLDLAEQQSRSNNRQNRPRDRQDRQRNGQSRPDDRDRNNPDVRNQPEDANRPNSPHPDDEKGKNTKNKKPPANPASRFERDKKDGKWGELPKYLQGIFKRGGGPKLPSKYRRFETEFIKKADRKKGK